jgi:hypothetical protein
MRVTLGKSRRTEHTGLQMLYAIFLELVSYRLVLFGSRKRAGHHLCDCR